MGTTQSDAQASIGRVVDLQQHVGCDDRVVDGPAPHPPAEAVGDDPQEETGTDDRGGQRHLLGLEVGGLPDQKVQQRHPQEDEWQRKDDEPAEHERQPAHQSWRGAELPGRESHAPLPLPMPSGERVLPTERAPRDRPMEPELALRAEILEAGAHRARLPSLPSRGVSAFGTDDS